MVLDLKTGSFLHTVNLRSGMEDLAFDKKGYLHCYFSPGEGCYYNGVGRLNPSQTTPGVEKG